MEKKKVPLWTGTFFMLIFLNLFYGVAGQMTVPLVADFATTLGADLTLASTVAGLMSLVSLFVCPFAGLLSDRVSRKKILIFASTGYGIALLLHSLANSVTLLIILRLFTGIFFSLVSVTIIAFSTSFIPRERTGEGLGYAALATILAQAIGPAIGIWLSEINYSLTFAVSGVSALVCLVILLLIPNRQEPIKTQHKKFSINDLFAVKYVGFMLLAALFSSGNGLVSTYLKIIGDERGIGDISLFFTVYSVCMVALRPLTGKLLDKKGVYIILIPSVFFAALGIFLVGISYTLGLLIVASVAKALGQGSGTPSLQAHVVKTLDKSKAGVATSTIMIGQNVGNAVAPIAGSFFVGPFGYEGMFCGFGVILLIAGMAILFLQSRVEKKWKNEDQA